MKYESLGYKLFYFFNCFILIVFAFVCLYPYINTLAVSLNDAKDSLAGGISFLPRVPTLFNLKFVAQDPIVQQAALVTTLRVIVAVMLNLTVQFGAAYALTKKGLPGKKFILIFLVIPMFFIGQLIPNYILYGKLGILNTFAVYVLPGMFSFFDMVVIRTYINTIPESLFESAKIDGANEIYILFRIVIPLSMPIIATIGLWIAVGHWNDWVSTLYYCADNKSLYTLQYLVEMFIKRSSEIQEMVRLGQISNPGKLISPVSLQAAQVIVTTIPIILVYPFLQKYFISGSLVGAVKE